MKRFRLVVYFLVGLLLGANVVLAHAAFSSYQGSAFRNINGTTYWKGDAGTLSQSKARVIESVNVGGKFVGVPYVGAVGAAALTASIAAMRSTPVGFAASLALPYLASKGIQLINGQWMSDGPSVPITEDGPVSNRFWSPEPGTCSNCSFSQAKAALLEACEASSPYTYGCEISSVVNVSGAEYRVDGSYYHVSAGGTRINAQLGTLTYWGTNPVQVCPTGYHESAGACFPDAYVPSSESDWDRVRGVTPPDDAMKDICARLFSLDGKGCQVANPAAELVTDPLSDWVTDPVTGVQTRQVAKISPAGTTEDPLRVQVTTETETKTPATTDPETGTTTPEKTETKENQNEDFCTLHPESLVCKDLDIPDAADISKNDKTVSITPEGGWGPDSGSCPSPKTATLRLGGQMSIDYGMVCYEMTTFRPVVIGFAWVAAILIAIGITKRYG